MSQKTNIEWTNSTWNPWHGCTKISSGCKYCYMFRDKERFNLNPKTVIRSKSKFNEPLKWKKPALVFTCSWSDFFIEDADPWRAEAWQIIKDTPHLTYQILTKRPDRILSSLPEDWGKGYENVWLGVSVEDHEAAIERIPALLSVPSNVRFISAEPLLSSIISDRSLPFILQLDWIIIGGESGNSTGKWRYRETQIDWIEEILALKTDVPIFVKQFGTYLSKSYSFKDKAGADSGEWHPDFRVRNFPKI